MSEPMPQSERGIRHLGSPIRKAGDPQCYGTMSVGAHAGIVTSIIVGVSVMSLGVIQRDTKLRVGKHNRIEAHHVGIGPARMIRLEHQVGIGKPPCHLDKLVGYSKRVFGLPDDQICVPASPHGSEELLVVAKPSPERHGTFVMFSNFGAQRTKTMRRDQRSSKTKLNVQLL